MREIHKNIDDTDIVASLYYALKACGRLDIVYYTGHDLFWFIDQFKKNITYWVVRDNQIQGYAMINQLTGNRAEISFAFLPTCTPFDSIWFGKETLARIFREDNVKYIYGTTPESNKQAIRYAKLVGMKHVATLPKYCDFNGQEEDGIMTFAEKESYLANH